MTLVVDASFVVAALVDTSATGTWAERTLRGQHLVAPALLPFEVSNVLRRLGSAGHLSADVASLAQNDLVLLSIELVDYEPLASRVWQLRDNLTSYDASYVALAELVDAPLATPDAKIANATTTNCQFLLPPAAD